jgi:hypothetical protein
MICLICLIVRLAIKTNFSDRPGLKANQPSSSLAHQSTYTRTKCHRQCYTHAPAPLPHTHRFTSSHNASQRFTCSSPVCAPKQRSADLRLLPLVRAAAVPRRLWRRPDDLGAAAQVEIESKFESTLSLFSFKRLVPGAFTVGLIGSNCTATPWRCHPTPCTGAAARVKRRKLKLKAKFEGGSSYYSFKRSVPGAVNLDIIGSTCTALPGREVSSLRLGPRPVEHVHHAPSETERVEVPEVSDE